MSQEHFSNDQEQITDVQALGPGSIPDKVSTENLNERFDIFTVISDNPNFNKNFPGSVILKKSDGTHFAIRKTKDGWEGNSFGLMNDGSIGAVFQEHDIGQSFIKAVESKMAMAVPVLDRNLTKLGVAPPEEMKQFMDEKKNLPPGATIDIYHGINGGLDGALAVLDSKNKGVQQRSGPCLALYPVGQFWKPGDAGFKYSIPRGKMEFPGETNPKAQFRIDAEGVIFLVNGLESLPLDQFEGVVMRTERKESVYEERLIDGEWKDIEVGEEVVPLTENEKNLEVAIQKRIKELSDIRTIHTTE